MIQSNNLILLKLWYIFIFTIYIFEVLVIGMLVLDPLDVSKLSYFSPRKTSVENSNILVK